MVLKKHKLKLNLEKCSFGIHADKFLGFMLTRRGIEANPKKCEAMINMRSPISVKEVHNNRFQWTDEYEATFQELKAMLASPSILTKSIEGTPILVYLSISNEAVSVAIVQELGKNQGLVYFISKVLLGVET
ncbi:Retrovirus-related Pol polyprotein from transposon opus, partial [Mucuna pruriens]